MTLPDIKHIKKMKPIKYYCIQKVGRKNQNKFKKMSKLIDNNVKSNCIFNYS